MAAGKAKVLGALILLVGSLPAPAANPSLPPAKTPAPIPAEGLDRHLFPVPAELEDNVAFWTDIFAEHTSRHAVLHDEWHLGIVYAILDFSKLEELSEFERRRLREKAVRETEQHYASILLALASDRAPDDEDHRRVRLLLQSLPGGTSKYREARDRLRLQTGLKDRFEEAIVRSGRYLAAMESAFADHGVPQVLTRMAFVESMFQEGARSKVGAGGIWQLMPATARQYLNVGAEADERFDPLVAADAAARILASNYRSLKSWPLAITAYNHGANGMRRAVESLGTDDPGTVLTRHRSRTYGFASRNFYAEFLAAAHVYANRRTYFPEAEPAPALRYDTFTPSLYVSILDLAHQSEVTVEELQALNPAFDSEVWRGGLLVPKGYRLRVPEGSSQRFAEAYAALPESRKSPHQAGHRHRVRSGDTLSGIAQRYGTSVAALQRANKLRRAHHIRIGQTLLIPARGGVYRPPVQVASEPAGPAAPPPAGGAPEREIIHVVQAGETLSALAERYGTTASTLTGLNELSSSHRIRIGQRLRIPAGGGAQHTVRPGETLARIAQIYGTTVSAIRNANRIVGHIIHPHQVLIIP